MKKRSQHAALGAALLIGAVIATILSWAAGPLAGTPASAAPGGGPGGGGAPPHANPVCAQKIAGTWIEQYHDGQFAYQVHYNIRADGTLDWFGSWFFGDGTQNFFDGPVYCRWRQTGPREITTIEVGMLFDGDGAFFATGRVIEVITFDEDFQAFDVFGSEDVFLPDQDPTDPNAESVASFQFINLNPVRRLNFMD